MSLCACVRACMRVYLCQRIDQGIDRHHLHFYTNALKHAHFPRQTRRHMSLLSCMTFSRGQTGSVKSGLLCAWMPLSISSFIHIISTSHHLVAHQNKGVALAHDNLYKHSQQINTHTYRAIPQNIPKTKFTPKSEIKKWNSNLQIENSKTFKPLKGTYYAKHLYGLWT